MLVVLLGYSEGLWTAQLWGSEPRFSAPLGAARFCGCSLGPTKVCGGFSCLHPPYHRRLAVGQVGSECGHTDVTNTCSMTCVYWWLHGICPNAMLSLSFACPSARGTDW